MGSPAKRNLLKALVDDVEQIEDNSALFHDGRNSAFQAVAIQLRNLMLGGRRALLPRIFPDARFHELRDSNRPERQLPPGAQVVSVLDTRGSLRLSTGAPARLDLSFKPGEPSLTLGVWLDQWIITPELSIRELIEEAANQEVAHTEEQVGRGIQRTSEFRIISAAGSRELHQMAIVAVGEYAARRTRALLLESVT